MEADLSRKENQALTELEIEARDRAQHLVAKATALRMEQEEEIKRLNKVVGQMWTVKVKKKKKNCQIISTTEFVCTCVFSPQLILDAQCQATRDVQIQEKKLSEAEFLEEEKRLDAMMEVARREALETQAQIDELHKQQRIRCKESATGKTHKIHLWNDLI